jgi:quercetin dioxygenase-like cupin family protein
VFRRDLPNVSLDGWEITVSHVDYPPGRLGQPHQHRGFLFAYVVEGSVIAQVIGEGVSDEVRTYRTGEMFYEPIGATHQVSRNASDTQPARLLAINLAKKEA